MEIGDFRGQKDIYGEFRGDSRIDSKDEEGLGVNDLQLFNLSLFNKWVWKCLSDENAIWFNVIKFMYKFVATKLLSSEGESGRRKGF